MVLIDSVVQSDSSNREEKESADFHTQKNTSTPTSPAKKRLSHKEVLKVAEERRAEIKEIFVFNGGMGLPIRQLARNFKVSERTIQNDLAKIRASFDAPDFGDVVRKCILNLENSLKAANKIVMGEKSTNRERLDAARTVGDLTTRYMDYMKRLGYGEETGALVQGSSTWPVQINIIERAQIMAPSEAEVPAKNVEFSVVSEDDSNPEETKG